MERKPGSVYSGDLKLIFVRMLRRPLPISHVSNMSAVCGWMSKFNYALNDAVAKNDLNIMTIMSRNGPEHYDRWRNLSEKGKSTFWDEINDLLERFNEGKVKLVPNQRKVQLSI